MPMVIALFLALGSFALAAPERAPPPAGRYAFTGTFLVALKKTFEAVPAFTDDGHARLAALQAQGYECANTGREIYLCGTFRPTDGAADLLRARVARALGPAKLTLGAVQGKPSLIQAGEVVAEYRVMQKATYDGKIYPWYRLVWVQGEWSIRLGEGDALVQFNLGPSGELTRPLALPVTESSTNYSVYYADADFRRM